MAIEKTTIAVNPSILNILAAALNMVDITDDYADFLMPCIEILDDADMNGGAVSMDIDKVCRMELVINYALKTAAAELLKIQMRIRTHAVLRNYADDFQRLKLESPKEYAKLTEKPNMETIANLENYLAAVKCYNASAREAWNS